MLTFLRVNWWIPVLIAVGVLAVLPWIDPAPPRSIVLATGQAGGGYEEFALRLQANLAAKGFTLELRQTGGSMENLQLLRDPASDVALALVQSGAEQLAPPGDGALSALGSLFYEPLWIFHRTDVQFDTLSELRGRRLGIGAPGSGTQAVARVLLERAGVLGDEHTTLRELGARAGAEALAAGEIDALFLVLSAQNETVARLARLPDVDFMTVRRAAAYRAHFPFLSSVEVPEGLLDLEANRPPEPRTLLSPVATLVANERFDPALTPLILEATREVLAGGGLLERRGQFPAAEFVGFPLAPEADYYYRRGLPLLQRFLPFWVASMVDRLIILALPLLALALPLLRFAGPIYEWRVRARVYRWYRHLRSVERGLRDGTFAAAQAVAEVKRLRQIERDLFRVQVPLAYAQELYQLHLHLDWLIRRLEPLCGQPPTTVPEDRRAGENEPTGPAGAGSP
jgi:TRAP transporter TAXI family solute receptor